MAFKLALDAGHGLHTNGKETIQRVPTKEWTLNDRVADHIELLLKDYDVEILRVDNDEGERDESLPERTDMANNWGADLYLSIHHNAFKPNVGQGVAVYKKVKDDSKLGQLFLERMAKYTGLAKRSVNIKKQGDGRDWFHVLRETKMDSFLLEGGFMTHWTDLEVITTMKGAKDYARAVAEVLIEYYGLKKKERFVKVFTIPETSPKCKFVFNNPVKGQEIYVKV